MLNNFTKFGTDIITSILSIVKVLIMSKYNVQFKKIKKKSDECVILGNGPSLNAFIESNIDFLNGKDSMCVNLFGRTNLYSKIKPNHYIITALQYWKGENQVEYIENRAKTLKDIADNTLWPMTFYAPAAARLDKKWISQFSANKNISIQYFNITPVEGFKSFCHSIFSLNLGMPRPHNVLISAIYVAIRSGYKRIYLAGADHSWLKDIFVTDDNVVLASQKHFYDQEFKDDTLNNSNPKTLAHNGEYQAKKLHQVLEKFKTTFESHHVLAQYSKKQKVEIINITPNSYIDSYPKMSL